MAIVITPLDDSEPYIVGRAPDGVALEPCDEEYIHATLEDLIRWLQANPGSPHTLRRTEELRASLCAIKMLANKASANSKHPPSPDTLQEIADALSEIRRFLGSAD